MTVSELQSKTDIEQALEGLENIVKHPDVRVTLKPMNGNWLHIGVTIESTQPILTQFPDVTNILKKLDAPFNPEGNGIRILSTSNKETSLLLRTEALLQKRMSIKGLDTTLKQSFLKVSIYPDRFPTTYMIRFPGSYEHTKLLEETIQKLGAKTSLLGRTLLLVDPKSKELSSLLETHAERRNELMRA